MSGRLCKCGCGLPTLNDYIKGHNRRGLVSNTKGGHWAKDYDCCIGCQTTTVKHTSQGLCNNCFRRLHYADYKVGKSWSRKHNRCIDCGTDERPHQANGRCGRCHANNRNRQKGVVKRHVGTWSWYYKKCKGCGTTSLEHAAEGLCSRCYQQKVRGIRNNKICPVCAAPVNKLFQHISMRAKKDPEHQEYLNSQELVAKELFFTDKTSQELADANLFGKRFILRVWHKFFSDAEIEERGEKIRVSKIQGSAHYLYGLPFPAIHPQVVKYVSAAGQECNLKSSWEVRFAQVLDELGIGYLYEPEGFPYTSSKGTKHHYWPDFYLPAKNVYVEIKGFMDERSEDTIAGFRKNFPEKNLVVLFSEKEIEEFLAGDFNANRFS